MQSNLVLRVYGVSRKLGKRLKVRVCGLWFTVY